MWIPKVFRVLRSEHENWAWYCVEVTEARRHVTSRHYIPFVDINFVLKTGLLIKYNCIHLKSFATFAGVGFFAQCVVAKDIMKLQLGLWGYSVLFSSVQWISAYKLNVF